MALENGIPVDLLNEPHFNDTNVIDRNIRTVGKVPMDYMFESIVNQKLKRPRN